jgi:excisionase family DNA binding protein
MLRVEEVAEAIGTTADTIRRWLREGKLRGVRPGGTKLGWRIPASEVDRILTGRPLPDDEAPKRERAA